MRLISPLAKVKGLGSAREGVHHWWAQRVTAVALIPLSLWFVTSMLELSRASHASVTVWFSSPAVAALMIALLLAMFYHAYLGVQVILEDYVHGRRMLIVSLMALKFTAVIAAIVSVLAVLRLHLVRGIVPLM